MSALGLTPRQRDVLTYVSDYLNARGYPPTYREIGASIGTTSMSLVSSLIGQIEARGYLRRAYGKKRSLNVVTGQRDISLGIELDAALCAEARKLEVSPESLIERAVEVYLREARA